MDIKADQVAGAIAKRVLPIYVVSGDEPLLVQEACDAVRAALRAVGYEQRELFHAEGNFDWREVLFSANSLSLFAEQKLIEVRMASSKPGKAAEQIVEYASDPPDGTVLLLVMPRLDRQTRGTKWFKTVDALAGVVQVWPVDAHGLPGWLGNRCRAAGLKPTREAILALAEKTEGNLLAAVQEIALLSLMHPDGAIDVDDVIAGVADHARFDVFTLIDAALAGDARRTVRILSGLRAEGEAPIAAVAMLARELRGLEKMARASESSSVSAVVRQYRVWQKRVEPVSRALSRLKPEQLQNLVVRSLRVDGMAKGYVPGNPWDELCDILLEVAGARVLPRSGPA